MVMEGSVEARPATGEDDAIVDDPWRKLAESRIGQTVGGRLHLERVLGIGGTATVYAARHRNGRALAVKILHPEYAHHDGIRRRFLAEGYAANKVEHADAVAVLDEGEDENGNVFLVMELLRGRSLWDRLLEEGSLPVEQVVASALRVLDVLGQAHERGVVHRDIKPANIFQTDDGAIKVLDFGIARVEGNPGAYATRPGTTLGTPAFMAPELAAGKLEQLDSLTDQWAVGATMFQLLTGETVHPSQTENEALVLAATKPARSLGTLRPDLAPGLVRVIDRALSFERRERFPNTRALSAALAESARAAGLLATLSVAQTPIAREHETAPEMSLPASEPPPPRRTRLALTLAAALVLALAVLGSLFALRRGGENNLVTALDAAAPLPRSSAASAPANELSASGAEPMIVAPSALAPAAEKPAIRASAEVPKGHVKAPPAIEKPIPPHPAPVATAPASHNKNPLFFPQ